LHPEAGRAFLRRLMKQAALGNAFAMDDLVAVADAGWDDADIALRELIAEFVNRNEPLPAVLAAYNIRALNPSRAPRARGPKPATNTLQDITIITLLTELVERFHLRPTRYQLGRRTRSSACSIASVALTEAGLHRGGEKAIQQIWGHYKSSGVVRGSRVETLIS
jgi:hypothetical protein